MADFGYHYLGNNSICWFFVFQTVGLSRANEVLKQHLFGVIKCLLLVIPQVYNGCCR